LKAINERGAGDPKIEKFALEKNESYGSRRAMLGVQKRVVGLPSSRGNGILFSLSKGNRGLCKSL